MTDLYLCRHCGQDVGTPKPFAMVVACPNCKLITAASFARALGAHELAKATLGMSHEQAQEKAEKAIKAVSGVAHTDCRTEDGITVQLVDTIINSARLLKSRDLMTPAAQDAIADMRHDEDVEKLMQGFEMDIRDRQRAEIARLRESNGEMDQRLSDNGFHMGKLFARLCAKLNLNPDSDTWFDIADKVEQQADELTTEKVESKQFQDGYTELWQALEAMQDAFDIGQPATPTSAIGKARAALKRKP